MVAKEEQETNWFLRSREERRRTKKLNLDLDHLSPSLIKNMQVPALLTFAVASNTDVLNAIIKRVITEEDGDGERKVDSRFSSRQLF